MENGPFEAVFPIKNWWFSIAMLVYQGVDVFFMVWIPRKMGILGASSRVSLIPPPLNCLGVVVRDVHLPKKIMLVKYYGIQGV